MENLGEYLKQKREEQGISIEELFSLTRIPTRFIEAIEANQLDLLPNQVSTKGFLKNYAECVGADYVLILEAFSEVSTPSESFPDDRSRNEILSHVQVEKSDRFPFPRRIILAVGGLVCALLILVGLLSKKDKQVQVLSSVPPPQISVLDRPDISEEASSEVDDALLEEDKTVGLESEVISSEKPPEEVTQEAKDDAQEEVLVSSQTRVSELSGEFSETEVTEETGAVQEVQSEEDQGISAVDAKEYVLSVEAIEASWVQVTIDGEEVREALLQPDDVVQWKANKKFLLTLGNAGGVRVKLDGRELDPFGPSGEVVRKEIFGEPLVEDD